MSFWACDEKGHGHGATCNVKVLYDDTLPLDMYDYEPIHIERNDKKIKTGEREVDVDQNRCCPKCYDKFVQDAKKNLKKVKFDNLNPL